MFYVKWASKDYKTFLDIQHPCKTQAEAETYAGIEMMQMEAENIKSHSIIEIPLNELFKIRDSWNLMYGLGFLENYIEIYKLQQIAQAINTLLDNAERG